MPLKQLNDMVQESELSYGICPRLSPGGPPERHGAPLKGPHDHLQTAQTNPDSIRDVSGHLRTHPRPEHRVLGPCYSTAFLTTHVLESCRCKSPSRADSTQVGVAHGRVELETSDSIALPGTESDSNKP